MEPGPDLGPSQIITGHVIIQFWRSAFSPFEGGFPPWPPRRFDRGGARPHCPRNSAVKSRGFKKCMPKALDKEPTLDREGNYQRERP